MVKPAYRIKGKIFCHSYRADSILVYLGKTPRPGVGMFFQVWPWNPHSEDLAFLEWSNMSRLKPDAFDYEPSKKKYIIERIWTAKWHGRKV